MYEKWERDRWGMTDEQYRRWRKILYGPIREWPVEFAYHAAQQLPIHSLRAVAAEWVKANADGLSIKELEEKLR